MCGAGYRNSICRTPVSTAPDLTASAPTPATATVNVAQAFSSTITNIGNASTGASFSNFFQVARRPMVEAQLQILQPLLCQLWLSVVQVLLPLLAPSLLPEHIQSELALTKVHLRISELLQNQMKTTTVGRWTNVVVSTATCPNGANNYPTCSPLSPPTNLILSCPSPGTNVSASWTAPSGWNTFYLRANPGANNRTWPSAIIQDTMFLVLRQVFLLLLDRPYQVWVHKEIQ